MATTNHGTSVRTCAARNCDSPTKTPGVALCPKHYERLKRLGTTDDCRECSRPAAVNGLCKTHARYAADPALLICSACGAPAYGASGLCRKHYNEHLAAKAEPCSLDGCDGPTKARGLCEKHYQRLTKNGTTSLICATAPGEAIGFLRQLVAGDDPGRCVDWPFNRNPQGYGQVDFEGRANCRAHRVSLSLHTGLRPGRETYACHKCGRPQCVSPWHLYWGDAHSNAQDTIGHGTFARGAASGNAKLTDRQVLAIRADQRLPREIAMDYGIHAGTVWMIQNRRSWRHLD